jgi:hypothetical protein
MKQLYALLLGAVVIGGLSALLASCDPGTHVPSSRRPMGGEPLQMSPESGRQSALESSINPPARDVPTESVPGPAAVVLPVAGWRVARQLRQRIKGAVH